MAKKAMDDLLKRRMSATQQASELQASDEAYEKLFREAPPAVNARICEIPLDKLTPFFTADIGFRPYTRSQLEAFAEQLKDVDLGYDVTFAFFTGGSYCWRGALQYASQLDREKLDSIAIVLNYSMLCGDNLYIYEGETKTTYGSFLNACADGATTKVPNDRNIGQFILEQDSVYNYVNIGM